MLLPRFILNLVLSESSTSTCRSCSSRSFFLLRLELNFLFFWCSYGLPSLSLVIYTSRIHSPVLQRFLQIRDKRLSLVRISNYLLLLIEATPTYCACGSFTYMLILTSCNIILTHSFITLIRSWILIHCSNCPSKICRR